jgi:hypothetical protein
MYIQDVALSYLYLLKIDRAVVRCSTFKKYLRHSQPDYFQRQLMLIILNPCYSHYCVPGLLPSNYPLFRPKVRVFRFLRTELTGLFPWLAFFPLLALRFRQSNSSTQLSEGIRRGPGNNRYKMAESGPYERELG